MRFCLALFRCPLFLWFWQLLTQTSKIQVCGIGLDIGRFNGFDEAHIFPGPNADYLTGHAGAAAVLHALYLRARRGGSYVTQCALLVSNLQMQSYGKYTDEQQASLKARNKSLIGHMRHYDEIVSHGKNRHVVRGFIADRAFEAAIKPEYYQTLDGSMWGLGPIDVIRLALRFRAPGDGHGKDQNQNQTQDQTQDQGQGQHQGHDSQPMRTDWVVGACPPGYHLPEWERKANKDFEPIEPVDVVQA